MEQLTHHWKENRATRRAKLYGRRKSSTLCTKKHTKGRLSRYGIHPLFGKVINY